MNDIHINLLDILEVFSKKARIFLITFIITLIISSGIVLILPKKYLAYGIILPESKSMGMLSDIIGSNKIAEAMSGGMFGSTNAKEIKEMLQSEQLIRAAIDSFHFIHVYKFDRQKKFNIEDVIKLFNRNYFISETDNKAIKVGFIDKDSIRAAAVVNFVFDKMNEINSTMSTKHAHDMRLFLEDRLDIEKKLLSQSENALEQFMHQNKVLIPESQIEAAASNAVSLMKMEYLASIDLSMAEKTYPADHPTVTELKNRVVEIQHQLAIIHGSDKNEFMFPLQKAPSVMKEYAILQREAKVHNEIYLYLCKLYEEVKYTEANTVPQIRILHKAFVPEKKHSPQRKKIVLLCIILFEFLAAILIFVKAALYNFKVSHRENYDRMIAILNDFTFGRFAKSSWRP